jgi:hypothetical protein
MAISDINSDAAIRASFAGSAPGNLVTSLATAAACAQAGIWPGRNQRLGLAVGGYINGTQSRGKLTCLPLGKSPSY